MGPSFVLSPEEIAAAKQLSVDDDNPRRGSWLVLFQDA